MKKGIFLIVLSNLFSIILIILNVITFIQYINHDASLIPLVTVLNIVEFIIGGCKGLSFVIPLCIGSIIAVKDFWLGIGLGLLFENVLIGTIGYLMYLIVCLKSKKL